LCQVGAWRNVSPVEFYLPQSRPRVYGLFLKQKGPGISHIQSRKEHLESAMALLQRLKVPGPPESLDAVLLRCAATQQEGGAAARQTRAGQPGSSNSRNSPPGSVPARKWQAQHKAWARKKGLTAQQLQDGYDAFKDAAGATLIDRQRESLWLKLVMLRKSRGLEWNRGLLVATVGASVTFLSVRQNLFPCVTPHMVYAILDHGRVSLAGGVTILAMQGVQLREFRIFSFGKEKCGLLRDLGGNAFTANIIAAFLIAGLRFM
jgi:hypothetical protein